jgi:hypothetical protein
VSAPDDIPIDINLLGLRSYPVDPWAIAEKPGPVNGVGLDLDLDSKFHGLVFARGVRPRAYALADRAVAAAARVRRAGGAVLIATPQRGVAHPSRRLGQVPGRPGSAGWP